MVTTRPPKTIVKPTDLEEPCAPSRASGQASQSLGRRPAQARGQGSGFGPRGAGPDGYVALMVGSSNFTRAGMGIGLSYNVEANLLTIVEHVDYGRVAGKLEAVWPEMESVNDPESAEWLGVQLENEGEEQTPESLLPEGFLAATYRAGDVC